MLAKEILFQNKFHFTSLGCARNLVDSEVMIGILLRAGYEIVQDISEADFLVVNTCGFLESARQEGLDTIRGFFEKKKASAKVIVAGCMVGKHKNLLLETFPEIHSLLGSGDVEKILDAIQAKEKENFVSAKSYLEWGEVPRMLSTPKHYAYLKIAEGCRKRCSFCIIPTIKGPLKSKSIEQVIKEFRSLLSQGVFEVILIAQDLGDFGKDRLEKRALATLLREMVKVEGNFWLRLLYLYPDEIDDEIIAIIEGDPRVCPYLDMPIQHISDSVLKAMHRKTSRVQIETILSHLRKKIPHISIRTSLMVGFPGETEADFKELVSFVKQAKLDQVGIFQFSLEKEAYAARLENQIHPEVKQDRFEQLAKVQAKVVEKKLDQMIGKKVAALVEGYHPESNLLIRARHQGQCPDIDNQILLNDVSRVSSFGTLHEVEITGRAGYDLVGTVTHKSKRQKSPLQIVSA